mgnify:CR=1 FL=1
MRHVGQAFSAVGLADPRITAGGKQDFRLLRLIASWKRTDPLPTRRQPIPLAVLSNLAAAATSCRDRSLAALMWLGLYFLLRPGEYLYTGPDQHAAFRLNDVFFRYDDGRVYSATASDLPCRAPEAVGLRFTFQKNGIPNETIYQYRTGDRYSCPVRAAWHQCHHLRGRVADDCPLNTYFDEQGVHRRLTPKLMTQLLRLHASAYCHPNPVSAACLRCTGATALLNAKTPLPVIQLIGRWRSDEVFRYLHAQSTTVAPLSRNILDHAR